MQTHSCTRQIMETLSVANPNKILLPIKKTSRSIHQNMKKNLPALQASVENLLMQLKEIDYSNLENRKIIKLISHLCKICRKLKSFNELEHLRKELLDTIDKIYTLPARSDVVKDREKEQEVDAILTSSLARLDSPPLIMPAPDGNKTAATLKDSVVMEATEDLFFTASSSKYNFFLSVNKVAHGVFAFAQWSEKGALDIPNPDSQITMIKLPTSEKFKEKKPEGILMLDVDETLIRSNERMTIHEEPIKNLLSKAVAKNVMIGIVTSRFYLTDHEFEDFSVSAVVEKLGTEFFSYVFYTNATTKVPVLEGLAVKYQIENAKDIALVDDSPRNLDECSAFCTIPVYNTAEESYRHLEEIADFLDKFSIQNTLGCSRFSALKI